ncbi:hypothetical protein KAI87_03050, partial [Myxococcota bacterium]|nr:hypothetical protein [Myxococcota bacterium]
MKIAIRSLSLSFLITLSTSSLAMASGLDNAAPERLSSIHAQDAALHRDVQPLLLRDGFLQSLKPAPKTAQKTATQSFTKTVFGYLPFWMEDGAQIPWEHLTHLSYFSAEASSAGNITNSHGWTSGGAALVATGKSHGVKVVLTVTIFGNAAVGELLGSTIAMDNLITNLLDLVQDAGGEGVNVDFEYVPATHKNEFVTFMTDLTEAFHSAVPGSHVSLASPAVDWSGAYDYDELAIHTDGLMIMGYDYHWSTSDPGPVAPIETG